MKTKLAGWALSLFCTGAALATAAPTPNEVVARQVEAAVEHAMLAADPSGKAAFAQAAAIDTLAAPLDAALAQAPGDPALLYTKAFCHFAAAVPLRWGKNKAGLQDRYEQAAALLEKVRGGVWEKEAMALEGYVLFQLVGLEGEQGAMELWPKADRLLSHAAKELAGSPRALFFRGHVLWTVPADVGGDPEKGLALMKAAVAAYDKDTDSEAAGPRWGRAYALGWVGSGLKRKGDIAGAVAMWHQTLAVAPDYAFVSQRLLPSVVKKPKAVKKA